MNGSSFFGRFFSFHVPCKALLVNHNLPGPRQMEGISKFRQNRASPVLLLFSVFARNLAQPITIRMTPLCTQDNPERLVLSCHPPALEAKTTSTRTAGQPASQRDSASPSCFRALGAGEHSLSGNAE
jgi:hypothetical protein